MLFEIELPPGETVKFVKEDTNTELIKLYDEKTRLRNEIKTLLKADTELQYAIRKIDYATNGYHMTINKNGIPLSILEYLYAQHAIRKGCVTNNEACPSYVITLYYKDPPPTKKLDLIYYYTMHNYGKPDATRLNGDLYRLQQLHKYLNIGGSAIFSVIGDNPTNGSIAFPFLLKSFFKQVIVGIFGFCIGIEYNGKPFSESGFPKISLNIIKPYVQFVTDFLKECILVQKLLLKPNKQAFFKKVYSNTLDMQLRLGIPLTKAEKDLYIFSLQTFQKNPSDYRKKISAGVNTEEGMFLYKNVLSCKAKKIVEIGFANGVSTAYLLIGAKETGGNVTSIDPFQDTQWKSAGLELVADSKLKTQHTWMKEKSHTALPRLLDKKGAENSYDMVFVDGWHTFDYTLVDAYFADKLLRVGGILVVDDFLHRGVNASMKYVITNWTHYKRLKSPHSFAAFEKISEDKRDWDFHKTF